MIDEHSYKPEDPLMGDPRAKDWPEVEDVNWRWALNGRRYDEPGMVINV